MTEFTTIGRRLPRTDGVAKATGQARYAGDIIQPRALYGKILRSHLPHARVLDVDTSRASRLPGVKAIIAGRDTLGIKYGTLRFRQRFMDEQALAVDKVRYIGDEVAAVAAIDEDVAEEALSLIKVEYEELPAVFDPDEAMLPGAPQIHEHAPGNLCRRIVFDFGDVEKGFAESYHVRVDRFSTHGAAHAPLEPHTCVAAFDASGKLTVWTSTQVPYFVKTDLALTLGIPESSVRVILPYVGGAFGGKSDGMFALDFCAALLSRKTGMPVRMAYTREEEFVATRRRHPVVIELKTGVSRDGVILAREARCVLDGGAYNGFGPATVLLCGIFLNLPYRYGSFKYEGLRIYTNNPVSSAMRGHGAPQVQFASEVQLDRLARDIGVDPLEIRLRNALKTGEVTLNGFKIKSSGFEESLNVVAEKSGWKERRGKLPPNRGLGIAGTGFPSGTGYRQRPELPVYSAAIAKLNEDGSIALLSGAADTGQGSDTALVQIVAEELGVDFSEVKLTRADTDVTPIDLGNFASRETMFAGNAAKAAAADLKQKLLVEAADLLEARPDDIEIRAGRVFVRGSADKALAFRELAHAVYLKRVGKPLVGEGMYDPPDKINYATYTFGAQVAEVEVDPHTGRVTVLDVVSAHDCGRAINPMAAEGQLEGSIHMGLGWALTEDLALEEGSVMNPSYLDYRVPTALEMPSVSVEHVETDDPEGPFGAKEAGEGIVPPTPPAIANAVTDATGKPFDDLPLDGARITDTRWPRPNKR
ncbi:MAG: molybdopterin-dependent oxidoreductase [Chloroflexi bacterium]|nr:molybdopterin-dependent oxidoreductase [Chloroflexota bacterium]